MAMVAVQQSSPLPLRPERLFVGVDVGKGNHVAAFYSRFLQRKHGHYSKSPTMPFANVRREFERLVTRIRAYAPLETATVILEKTGHYHLALLQYLQEQGVECYLVHVGKRPRRQKNDRKDAQGLANMGLTQLELGAMPDNPDQELHRVLPTSEIVQALRGLVQCHTDISKQIVRCKNQLTAIADLLFPELTQVFKNVNLPTALVFRERWPTPTDIAHAPLPDLIAARYETRSSRPGKDALLRLKSLAAHSIGITSPDVTRALITQQRLLIRQLRTLEKNEEEVKAEIADLVPHCRQGQILLSFGDYMGHLAAAQILACIGTIANFESASKFKGYTGWHPVEDKSGKSKNGVCLAKTGNRLLRHTLYLVGLRAVNSKYDTEWHMIYQNLVRRQCPYDAGKGAQTHKIRPLSRIIGQISSMIYAFLRRDAEALARAPEGSEPPPPMLYDRLVHHSHIRRQR